MSGCNVVWASCAESRFRKALNWEELSSEEQEDIARMALASSGAWKNSKEPWENVRSAANYETSRLKQEIGYMTPTEQKVMCVVAYSLNLYKYAMLASTYGYKVDKETMEKICK